MRMDRRTALRTALFLGIPWLFTGRRLNAGKSKTKKESGRTVVVIGAGIAGLAAARQLTTDGFRVIVLESRDRPGGRIWTDNTLGTAVDLGAAWIHGDSSSNPLMKMVNQYGLTTKATDWDETWLFDRGYGVIEDRTYDEIERKSEQIIQRLYQMQSTASSDQSVSDALRLLLKELDGDSTIRRGINWWLASEIGGEYADNFDRIPLKYWDADEGYSGYDVMISGGLKTIIEQIKQGIDIRYGHIVDKVDYSNSMAKVSTSQGTIDCDHVVVTVPLGVLQQQRIRFNPQLPNDKLESINRLGMGVMNKLVLRFPKRFWPKDAHRLGLLKSTTENLIEYYPMTPYSEEPIIVGLTWGRHAKSIESAGKDDVVQLALSELKTMLGSSIPSEVSDAIVTRWHSDEFSGGSYSHILPGSSFSDYRTLAKPIGKQVYFAGEATNDTHPGTVHGAYSSGIRAAKEIMILND